MAVNYGTDLLCLNDLDAEARDITGPELVAQDLYHDLTEPPGSLLEAPDGTIDIRAWLQVRRGPNDIAEIQDKIQAIFVADERIAEAHVKASIDVPTQRISVRASGRLVIDAQPFQWVFELTADNVSRIQAGV